MLLFLKNLPFFVVGRRSSINRPPTPNDDDEEEELGKEASLGDIINLKVLPARLPPPPPAAQQICGRGPRLSFLFYLLGLGLLACYERLLGLPAAAGVMRMGDFDSILARVW